MEKPLAVIAKTDDKKRLIGAIKRKQKAVENLLLKTEKLRSVIMAAQHEYLSRVGSLY